MTFPYIRIAKLFKTNLRHLLKEHFIDRLRNELTDKAMLQSKVREHCVLVTAGEVAPVAVEIRFQVGQ